MTSLYHCLCFSYISLRGLIMEKIQAINELYNSIYAAPKANSDLRKYVTNIYRPAAKGD